MTVRSGSASATVTAAPDEVFGLVTDTDRLPEWNEIIRRVTSSPAALEPSSEWYVEIKPPGMPSWVSKSTVLELDRAARRFRHRTQTDDGNPSWADWTWQVDAVPEGSRVTVSWELHPVTLARRVLFSRIRNRALRKEVPASIARIDALLTTSPRS